MNTLPHNFSFNIAKKQRIITLHSNYTQKLNKKKLFQEFSEKNKDSLPFSLHYSWWNEVVKDNWDVAVVANSEQVFAIMPYYVRKKGPWVMVTNAHFTPYTGPFHNYAPEQKSTTKIAFEHNNNELLIAQLPKFSEYAQNFHLQFDNALQFQWKGFNDTNRYTYLLDLSLSEKQLFTNFRENTKRQIKKATKTLIVEETKDIALVEKLCKESAPNTIESAYFRRIGDYIEKYKCGKIWKAYENGNDHATLLTICDKNSAYYLIGGSANQHRKSGAISLLMWEAIKNAKQLGLKYFNFEGSSVESIEQYLRGFGGELVSFRRITKNNSKVLEMVKKLKK